MLQMILYMYTLKNLQPQVIIYYRFFLYNAGETVNGEGNRRVCYTRASSYRLYYSSILSPALRLTHMNYISFELSGWYV